ncbi:hypothetical protein [Bordetella sp. 2513F-2]
MYEDKQSKVLQFERPEAHKADDVLRTLRAALQDADPERSAATASSAEAANQEIIGDGNMQLLAGPAVSQVIRGNNNVQISEACVVLKLDVVVDHKRPPKARKKFCRSCNYIR